MNNNNAFMNKALRKAKMTRSRQKNKFNKNGSEKIRTAIKSK